MADYVTVKMHDEATFTAAIAALPKSDPLSRLIRVDKVYLKDLGLRNLNNPALLAGQALYMEHWDLVSPPIPIQDLLLGTPSVFSANKGRIKYLLSDEVQHSIEIGLLKKYVDAGLFEIEGYSSDLVGNTGPTGPTGAGNTGPTGPTGSGVSGAGNGMERWRLDNGRTETVLPGTQLDIFQEYVIEDGSELVIEVDARVQVTK